MGRWGQSQGVRKLRLVYKLAGKIHICAAELVLCGSGKSSNVSKNALLESVSLLVKLSIDVSLFIKSGPLHIL